MNWLNDYEDQFEGILCYWLWFENILSSNWISFITDFKFRKIMFVNRNFKHIEKLNSNSARKIRKSHQVWKYSRAMICIFEKHILYINEIQKDYVMIILVNSVIKWLESMLKLNNQEIRHLINVISWVKRWKQYWIARNILLKVKSLAKNVTFGFLNVYFQYVLDFWSNIQKLIN